MTQQAFSGPGTAVAEPPAPILPPGFDDEDGGNENRRKLMVVGAALGVLVLVVVAFFLLKGGGSAKSSDSFAVPHHAVKPAAAAPHAPAAVKLPKVVTAPAGKDPFKPLYQPPAPKPTAAAKTSTTPVTPPVTTVSGGTTSGSTAPAPAAAYAPVWIELVSVNGTKSATFTVGYSNGKSLRTATFSNVAAPTNSLRTDFGNVFSLLSIQDGQATVQFGDGSPFDLAPGASHRHQLG